MTEAFTVSSGTPEQVALELTINICIVEGLSNDKSSYRKNLLDLYAECLEATNYSRDI